MKNTVEHYKRRLADFQENFADTPTEILAERWGITMEAARAYASAHGLKKSEKGKAETDKIRIAKMSHTMRTDPVCIARMKEHIAKHGFKKGHVYYCKETPEQKAEHYRKISETRKRIVSEERMRIKYGLKQKTKLILGRTPEQFRWIYGRLKEHGYIIDKKNAIAYFDENTKRCPIVEARKPGDRHYKYIRFMPTANYITK